MEQSSYFESHIAAPASLFRSESASQGMSVPRTTARWTAKTAAPLVARAVAFVAVAYSVAILGTSALPLGADNEIQALATAHVHGVSPNLQHWSLPSAPPEWPVPCEEAFEQLATKDVFLLERWIVSGELRPAQLTYAAEALGRFAVDASSVATLLRLLDNDSRLVREGAILGLSHLPSAEVLAHLERVSVSDPSPAVKRVAKRTLDELSC